MSWAIRTARYRVSSPPQGPRLSLTEALSAWSIEVAYRVPKKWPCELPSNAESIVTALRGATSPLTDKSPMSKRSSAAGVFAAELIRRQASNN